jgi:hypothetical protein
MRLGAESFSRLDAAMSERPESPAVEAPEAAPVEQKPGRSVAQSERAERLAKALRDNLRRRKAPRAPSPRSEN